jgi:hypothetical protein
MRRAAKKSFHTLVQPLSLPISLGVVSGAHHQLGVGKFEQFLPERTGENLISVRDDALRKSMQLVNSIQKCLSHLGSCEWMSQGQEVPIFGEFVDYHQNHIIAMGLGQTFDKIKTHSMPWKGWNWEGLEQTWHFRVLCFCLLAN